MRGFRQKANFLFLRVYGEWIEEEGRLGASQATKAEGVQNRIEPWEQGGNAKEIYWRQRQEPGEP